VKGVLLLALATAPGWSKLDDSQRAEAMSSLQKLPTLRERVLSATDGFLGTPYVLSPLGEGEGRDPDPLIRFDAVDCVTMIEESFALSTATPETLVESLTTLRYDGDKSWNNRLHIMESQWLPENVKRGLLKDVTREYGGDATKTVVKEITAATWKEKNGKSLGLPAEKQTVGSYRFDIIPAAVAAEKLKHAPAGLLVVVFRADRSWWVTRVSHVGVLVQSDKGPMLRHASRSFKKVVDEPLQRYLARNLDFGTWTIDGLAIFEPTLPK